MRILAAVVFFMLLSAPAFAQGKSLQIDLADDRVDITTGFNGTKVVLFGTSAMEGADLIVALKGPERTMKVRRKDKVFGAWVNHDTVEFRRVPSYYDLAASMDEDKLKTYPDLLKAHQIGVDNLGFYSEDEDETPEVVNTFRDALIRSMQEKGFYLLKPHEPEFINERFFKTVFELPPGVPTGIYTVEALLVKDGILQAQESKTLQVGQVGFNARVYSFSNDHSFFYGVLAVFIALFSGWSAFTFLRRD